MTKLLDRGIEAVKALSADRQDIAGTNSWKSPAT